MASNDIDKHLGGRIREAREARGLAVERLAHLMEDAPDVLTAMEAGQMRVSALRLARISRSLGMPLSWFFEGLPGQEVFGDKASDKSSV